MAIERPNTRFLNRSKGTRGKGRCSSRRTSRKPARAPKASSAAPISLAEVRTTTSTPLNSRPKDRALSTAAGRSNGLFEMGFEGSAKAAITRDAAPMGTLTANSQGHGATANMAEAMVGPMAADMATTRAFSPTPRPSIRLE